MPQVLPSSDHSEHSDVMSRFKFLLYVAVLWLHVTVANAGNLTFNLDLFGTSQRRDLPFPELCIYDGYEPETHNITTEDGYILTLFRVLPKTNETGDSKIPLVFMHGLYLSADDCIIPGPKIALCYILADSGYDVWVPNVRGNKYSRNHTSLDPDKDSEFWNFSIDEMSQYDLPAVLDYVLNVTGKPKVNYVGHSQGVTLALLLCSKQTEYNSKINLAFGLSTTAWLYNAKFPVLSLQGILSPLLSAAVSLGLNMEVLAYGSIAQTSVETLCGLTELSYPFCSLFLFAVLGYNHYEISNATLPVFAGHEPAGTSLKNFNHWGVIREKGFIAYDYGTLGNFVKYGQITAPEYDVSTVTAKFSFIGSLNDYVSNITDLATLTSKMPNTTTCVLSDKLFGHLDFVFGDDIPNYITPVILAAIENGTDICT